MHTEWVTSPIQFLRHPWQLISTLWEGPPVIAPQISATGMDPSSITAPLQNADQLVPRGLCGWVSAEPGSPGNFVCKAMGQVMPGVVFLVSLTVLAATMFFLIRYLLRSAALASELERLAIAFESMAIPSGEWARKDAWEKILRTLIASGEETPPLREFAKRMQISVIPLPSSPEQHVVLKESVSVLAGQFRKRDRWSGQTLAEALPGWLTAIGLLTTFLAILLGLQGVKVLTNLEVNGIGGLVNGLSGKFFSSIVALGCAISITITHYFVSGSTNMHWNRLVDRLQELVPHLSMERIFLEMINARKSER